MRVSDAGGKDGQFAGLISQRTRFDSGVRNQTSFRFAPLPGEVLNLGKMGLALNWRRIARQSRIKLQTSVTEELLSFETREYCAHAALLEEIRRQMAQRARTLRRALSGRKRKSAAAVEFCRSVEGRRAQIVVNQLIERLGEWETARLCG